MSLSIRYRTRASVALLLAIASSASGAYRWPSPQYDALEEMLYEGQDKMTFPIGSLTNDCISRVFDGGPPVGAEWLRLAYHDMATHNITAGTGGLDASIYYEFDRPENIGQGILSSLNDFASSGNKYVSSADIIAMGAIWGVASCGGPAIPFRGGRIDARAAGRAGVPEPQQDLHSHTESFRLQGFTQTEMIGLVACGHTFGGVRNLDFPTIVPTPDGSADEELVGSFDTTTAFDSTVVTQYLDGTTKNPLVVAENATFHSDLRIFSSDGNATMKGLQAPSAFTRKCTTLLQRMLETVPAHVKLTQEITFVPFKVRRAQITVVNSQIVFHVGIRVQVPPGATRNVTLFWCDRRGPDADCARGEAHFAVPVVSTEFPDVPRSPLTVARGIVTQPFFFTAPLTAASVSHFWFEVAGAGPRGAVQVEDNGGAGYVIPQDTLVALSSVPVVPVASNRSQQSWSFDIIAGVRTGGMPTVARVHVLDKSVGVRSRAGKTPAVPPPVDVNITLVANASLPAVEGYTFFTGQHTDPGTATLDFTAQVGGQRFDVDFMSLGSAFFDDYTLSGVGTKKVVWKGVNGSGGNTAAEPLPNKPRNGRQV